MKNIAFSTSGLDLDAPMDPRFGRAAGFLLFNTDDGTLQHIENRQARNASQGAGIQAAETIVKAGAQAIVTGHCGPKAFRLLDAAGIAVYNSSASTVREALDAVKSGSLSPAVSADVEGHW